MNFARWSVGFSPEYANSDLQKTSKAKDKSLSRPNCNRHTIVVHLSHKLRRSPDEVHQVRKNKEDRTERVTKAAQAELAKSGIVQFRVERAILQRLYDLAHERKIRLSTMLCDWVVEKLDQSADPATATDMKGLYVMVREMQKEIQDLKSEKVSEVGGLAYGFSMSKAQDGIFLAADKSINSKRTIVVVSGVLVPCTVDADGNPNPDDIRNALCTCNFRIAWRKSKNFQKQVEKNCSLIYLLDCTRGQGADRWSHKIGFR